MLAHIPTPQPDQTMESLAAVAAIFNGMGVRKKWANALFGIQNYRCIDTIYHKGSRHLFGALSGAGYASCADFVDNHGPIGMFKPFAPPPLYDRARDKLIGDNVHGIASLLGTSGISPFAEQTRYCQECAIREIRSLGFAYAHRTHQVLAVTTCPIHGSPLGTLSDQGHAVTATWGLLMPKLGPTSLDEFALSPIDQLESNSAGVRLGAWVHAAYNGQLVVTSTGVRQQLIRSRLDALPKKPHVPALHPARLELKIASEYRESYLSALGLDTREGPTRRWPSKLMRGEHFVDHAVPNLLVLATLFDTTDDYNRAAARLVADNQQPAEISLRPGVPRIDWGLGVIKDILRMPRLEDIAAMHGMHIDTVMKRLRANPTLARRRRQYLAKIDRNRCRAVLEAAVENNPFITRFEFRQRFPTAYERIMANDRNWFNRCLPPHGHPIHFARNNVSRSQYSGEDERLAHQLREKAQVLITGKTPKQVTKSVLKAQVNGFPAPRLLKNAYPRTTQVLSELIESSEQYQARVVMRMQGLVEKCDTEGAKLWATNLIAQFANRQDIVTRVVDILINRAACPARTSNAFRQNVEAAEAEVHA